MLVMALTGLMLATGCETDHRGGRADFANTAQTEVDIFRNGHLQFSLPPDTDGDCRVELGDDFAVLDRYTGQVLGSCHVDADGYVSDVRVTAIIFDDHVEWSTDIDVDDW